MIAAARAGSAMAHVLVELDDDDDLSSSQAFSDWWWVLSSFMTTNQNLGDLQN